MKSKIMVVDDEMHIRELVRFYLDKAGFDTIEAANAEEALDIVENQYIDLAVVDIMMPGMDGFELVEQMRQYREIPVIMLTAKSQSKDKLRGFSLGIDDYVTKPFDPDELMARVKTILKRYSINSSNVVKIGDVIFDGDKYEVRYQEQVIHLPLKQFELAFELAKNPNQIFTREQLIEKIWGMDYDGFDRTVDVHIKRIRENLGHLPGFKVVTVRGLGYKIEVE
ncbi:response regulator transcription factor [Catenibacterium mitsuokai]|uniref:response regulator transcription factor n=1 Tax=Catenibacterium TaxID=135858 RepID=UPI0006C4CF75|nr:MULTISPECIES: response regulator transcription factor [Catenibacterium]MCI6075859.1 response regulator transcription factor [Catenibacterium mitsuokai]MDD6595945.1 response regulator transcription factor [Catenibacterium mitsuokai]CUO68366.1 Heme response regulator hssR [Catenibacterium mitsuokai]CUP53107.1 Heme response regulator hssR [Roseburia hominis]